MTTNLLSVGAAAQALGISARTVYDKIAAGELAVVRIGRRTLIEPSEVERFIEERRVAR